MAVEVVELLSAVLQHSPSNRTGMLHINGMITAGICRPAVMCGHSRNISATGFTCASSRTVPGHAVLPWLNQVFVRERLAYRMLPACVMLLILTHP